ncbi:hypothetical protein V8F06_013940 [Rhypophila decipiens]
MQANTSFHTRNNTYTQTATQTSPSYQSAFLFLLILTTLGDSGLVLGLIFYQPQENVFTSESGALTLAIQFIGVQLLSMLVHINTCHALGSRVAVLKRRKGWRTFAYGVVTVIALAAMFVLGLPVLILLDGEWEYYRTLEVSVVAGIVGLYWVWYLIWGVWKAVVWRRYEKKRDMEGRVMEAA